MIPHAGEQFEAVRQFDDVVVGSDGEGLRLHGRLLLGGEHDDRHVAKPFVGPKLPHEREAVDLGHHEILQDHRGPHLRRLVQGRGSVFAVVEGDSLLSGEHPPHGLADDRLVVDEQHGDAAVGGSFDDGHGRRTDGSRITPRCYHSPPRGDLHAGQIHTPFRASASRSHGRRGAP